MHRTGSKSSRMQTFKLDADIVSRLDRYSAETGVSKTFVVEKALEGYLDLKEGRVAEEEDEDGSQK